MSHYPGGMEPSDEDIERTLADVVRAIEEKGLPYLLMGGAGTVTFGRSRATNDIDVFVRAEDAGRVLEVLAAACELDWDYIVDRARSSGPRWLLSLLLYAESNDLAVPSWVVESLFATVHGS